MSIKNIVLTKYLFATFIILFAIDINAQLTTATALIKIDDATKAKLKARILQYKKKVNEKIKDDYKGKVKSNLETQYKEFVDGFISEIDKDRFLINVEMDSFLYLVYDKLKFPSTIVKPIFLIAKDYTYNAFCTPVGIIIINMAVFNFADNEDQIASIICHEMAHHTLDHYLKISSYILEEELSKELKQKVKEIKGKSNSSENAMILLKKKLYGKSKFRQRMELEADSLGFLYYQQSDYSKGSFINSLEHTEQSDSTSYLQSMDSTIYLELFNLSGVNFTYDLFKDESTSYKYFEQKEEFDSDSLSTHPEIALRVSNLKRIYNIDRDTFNINRSIFLDTIYDDVRDELLPLLFQNEDYGQALYITLFYFQMTKGTEQFESYKAWLGILFEKLSEARANYTFNRYVDNKSIKTDDLDYKKFLNFIWNLSLGDLKLIHEHYKTYIRN